MQSNVQYSQQQAHHPQGMNIEQQSQPFGDIIDQLPSDQSVPSHNEITIVDQLFKQKKGIFDRVLHQSKDIVVLAGLFVVFSLPFVDSFIKKFITAAVTSDYILISVKALLFVLVYFVIKNIYLVRKK